MTQPDLLTAPTPARTTADDRPLDLLGQPYDPPVQAAPKYRPKAPVQQGLNLDAFNLGSK